MIRNYSDGCCLCIFRGRCQTIQLLPGQRCHERAILCPVLSRRQLHYCGFVSHHGWVYLAPSIHRSLQKSKGTWEAAKQATMEAEKQGAEAHLKSCEAEHLLQSASELTQAAASARAREEEVRRAFLC